MSTGIFGHRCINHSSAVLSSYLNSSFMLKIILPHLLLLFLSMFLSHFSSLRVFYIFHRTHFHNHPTQFLASLLLFIPVLMLLLFLLFPSFFPLSLPMAKLLSQSLPFLFLLPTMLSKDCFKYIYLAEGFMTLSVGWGLI